MNIQGIPYSTDMCPCHLCFYPDQPCVANCDGDSYVPCPLLEMENIVQQPADYTTLSASYANAATSFIRAKAGKYIVNDMNRLFFSWGVLPSLYSAFPWDIQCRIMLSLLVPHSDHVVMYYTVYVLTLIGRQSNVVSYLQNVICKDRNWRPMESELKGRSYIHSNIQVCIPILTFSSFFLQLKAVHFSCTWHSHTPIDHNSQASCSSIPA